MEERYDPLASIVHCESRAAAGTTSTSMGGSRTEAIPRHHLETFAM